MNGKGHIDQGRGHEHREAVAGCRWGASSHWNKRHEAENVKT